MKGEVTSTTVTMEGSGTVTNTTTATPSSLKTTRKRKRSSIGENNDDSTAPSKTTREHGIAKDRDVEAKSKTEESKDHSVLASLVSAPVSAQTVSQTISEAATAETGFNTLDRSPKKTRNDNNQQADGMDNSTDRFAAPVASSVQNQDPENRFAAPSEIVYSPFSGTDGTNSRSSTTAGGGLTLPSSGITLPVTGITATSGGLTMPSRAPATTAEREGFDDQLEEALEDAFIALAAEETLAQMNEAGFGGASTVSQDYSDTAFDFSSDRPVAFHSLSSQPIATPPVQQEAAEDELFVSRNPSLELVDDASDPSKSSAQWSQSTMNSQDEVFGQDMQLRNSFLDEAIDASKIDDIPEPTRNPLNFMSYGNPPPPGANAMLRLECFAIDFALSPSNFRLEHRSGPYFTSSLDEEARICFVKEFSTATHRINQVRQAYSLPLVVDKIMVKIITWSEEYVDDPGYTYYNIRCSAEAFYGDGNTVLLDIDDDTFRKWRMSIGPSWRLKGCREDDTAFDSIEWRGIVNLLAAFAVNVFNHGVRRLEHDVVTWMSSTDPPSPIGVDEDLWDRIRKEGHFGMSSENLRQLKVAQIGYDKVLTVGSLNGLENRETGEVTDGMSGEQEAATAAEFEANYGELLV